MQLMMVSSNGEEQLGDVKGLGDEIVSPLFHAVDGRVQGAVTGDHDHGDVGIEGAHGLKKLLSPHDRHLEVQENQVNAILGKKIETPLTVLGGDHVVPSSCQKPLG
jgi:hypothetical protein